MAEESRPEYQAKQNAKANNIREFQDIIVSVQATKINFVCPECNNMISRDCGRCAHRLGINLNELNYYGLDITLHLSQMWHKATMEWLDSTNILNNPVPKYIHWGVHGRPSVDYRIQELEDEIEQLKL